MEEKKCSEDIAFEKYRDNFSFFSLRKKLWSEVFIKIDYYWVDYWGNGFDLFLEKWIICIIMYSNFDNFKSKVMNKYWSNNISFFIYL